jgi:hypothetical protein
MDRSEQLGELFSALAKAQSELLAVPFDSKNPHFGNEFASLAAIQDATKPVLAKNGLAVSQILDSTPEGFVLHTLLGHSSGQHVTSTIRLVLAKNDMQALGSATTYAKRYAWQALVGVSGDQDDDAEAAVGRDQKPARPPVKNYAPASAEPREFREARERNEKNGYPGTVSLAEFERVTSGDPGPVPDEIDPLTRALDRPDPSEELRTYKVPWGKHLNKTIAEIGLREATGYLDYLLKSAKPGEPLKPNVLTYQRMVNLAVQVGVGR